MIFDKEGETVTTHAFADVKSVVLMDRNNVEVEMKVEDPPKTTQTVPTAVDRWRLAVEMEMQLGIGWAEACERVSRHQPGLYIAMMEDSGMPREEAMRRVQTFL